MRLLWKSKILFIEDRYIFCSLSCDSEVFVHESFWMIMILFKYANEEIKDMIKEYIAIIIIMVKNYNRSLQE